MHLLFLMYSRRIIQHLRLNLDEKNNIHPLLTSNISISKLVVRLKFRHYKGRYTRKVGLYFWVQTSTEIEYKTLERSKIGSRVRIALEHSSTPYIKPHLLLLVNEYSAHQMRPLFSGRSSFQKTTTLWPELASLAPGSISSRHLVKLRVFFFFSNTLAIFPPK